MTPLLPRYTHIVNPKLKYIYLKLDDEGNLIIKSPKVSQQRIEQMILQKSSWINRTREKIASKKGRLGDFSQLYYLGNVYPLEIAQIKTDKTFLQFDGERFLLTCHHYDTDRFHKAIDRFYRTQAQRYIPSLVAQWGESMGLMPAKVTFRKTKRQWGSCSANNALSFNTSVMKLPKNVIEYIIVHELAHIRHKHHQKPFWQLVENHMPQYKSLIKVLKTYT